MGWMQIDANNDGYTDWAWDGDNDGFIEELWVDFHGDGDYDARVIDSNEDGHAEWINVSSDGGGYRNIWLFQGQYHYGFVDTDRNGTWDVHTFDGERDGYHEWLRLDTNYDGHADTWYQNNNVPAYQDVASATARQMVQNQANVAAVSVLFNAARASMPIL